MDNAVVVVDAVVVVTVVDVVVDVVVVVVVVLVGCRPAPPVSWSVHPPRITVNTTGRNTNRRT
jgi:hypothetical protein